MHEVKDTQRAVVRIGYDGRVHKNYRGHFAKERYENEVRVLRYLEKRGCDFVPRLLEDDSEHLYTVTTNCGRITDSVSDAKANALFAKLEEEGGVRHGDAAARNITYDAHKGRFCVIDFEFSTILETGEGLIQEQAKPKSYERPR